MEKRLIYTLAIGNEFEKCFKLAHTTFEAYAKKVNADLIIQTESEGHAHIWFEKFSMKKYFDKYDRILYIDSDVLIHPNSPNIFEEVAVEDLALFNEGRFVDRKDILFNYFKIVKFDGKWNEKYFNAGIMLIPKQYKYIFDTPLGEFVRGYCDQDHINYMICKHKIKVHELRYQWNRMSLIDSVIGEHRLSSFFIHYAGGSRTGANGLYEVMNKDYQEIIQSPNKIYPRNIAVMIGGGMGDQICAEPTLRFIKEKLYKGDNVIAFSHWPEIFSHLNIPIYLPNANIQNPNSYAMLHTLKDPQDPTWKTISHMLTTAVDYAAILATRGTLPLEYKQIKLEYSDKDYNKIKELCGFDKPLIVIHAGRHWESKTFPSDVWQSYVDILTTNGHKVIVIGKRVSKEQGVVEIDTSNCIDLIDKTSIKEMIALIANCQCLITNDSVPVHIAGAFDNVWIGLIATTKHPHKILPYRGKFTSQLYKTECLEIKPIYDDYESRPTFIDCAKVDKCEESKLRSALPSPEKILEFVNKCIN